MKKINQQSGFSLIEIIVVLAILTILASVALYNYSSYLLRANRTDAMKFLLDVAARQENYYSFKYKYTTDLNELALSTDQSDYGHYKLTITLEENDRYYLLKASPIGGQASDSCGSFELDSNGVKKAAEADCWK